MTKTTIDGRSWTHRVVKRMRGMNGAWFDFPTAATFGAEADARAYAEDFAREQGEAGVYGARICVRTRRGDTAVATYRSDDYITERLAAN